MVKSGRGHEYEKESSDMKGNLMADGGLFTTIPMPHGNDIKITLYRHTRTIGDNRRGHEK